MLFSSTLFQTKGLSLPASSVLDKAQVHEHQACVRYVWGWTTPVVGLYVPLAPNIACVVWLQACTFTCNGADDGVQLYAPIPAGTTVSSTCQADGTWTTPTSACLQGEQIMPEATAVAVLVPSCLQQLMPSIPCCTVTCM